MADTSPILGLPYIQPSQAQKHVTHNEAIQVLDVVTQLVVEAFDADTPPTVAGEGAVYALGGAPTGAWAGHAFEIAVWRSSAWAFFAPLQGWRAWGRTHGDFRVWDGGEWATVKGETQNLDGIGIQTNFDTQNRLAVRGASTLLTNEGSGHQLKINKAGAGDTASLVFQSNWTGYAEMGLAGSEAFSVKVSHDGSSWTEAIRFDGASGLAEGAAVQTHGYDATAGRLLCVGAFGLGAEAPQEISDLDDASLVPGIYRTGSATANIGALPEAEGVLEVRSWDASHRMQLWTGKSGGACYQRVWQGVAWSDWVRRLDGGQVVGTVSETGGLPTGAIFESGENANGRYVRYADGTQICHRVAGVDVTSLAVQAFDFAASFAEVPAVSFGHVSPLPNAALSLGNIRAVSGAAGVDQHWAVSLVAAGVSSDPADDAEKLALTAVGRWF